MHDGTRGTDYFGSSLSRRKTRPPRLKKVLEGAVELESGDQTVLVPAQQGVFARGSRRRTDPRAPARKLPTSSWRRSPSSRTTYVPGLRIRRSRFGYRQRAGIAGAFSRTGKRADRPFVVDDTAASSIWPKNASSGARTADKNQAALDTDAPDGSEASVRRSPQPERCSWTKSATCPSRRSSSILRRSSKKSPSSNASPPNPSLPGGRAYESAAVEQGSRSRLSRKSRWGNILY